MRDIEVGDVVRVKQNVNCTQYGLCDESVEYARNHNCVVLKIYSFCKIKSCKLGYDENVTDFDWPIDVLERVKTEDMFK